MASKLKAVLFDCDGVIIDSEIVFVRSVAEFLRSMGQRASLEELSTLVGMSFDRILQLLRERYPVVAGLSNTELETGIDAYFDARWEAGEATVIFGVRELLECLCVRGIACGLVSSSDMPYLQDVLSRHELSAFFSCVVSADDVVHAKPAPEIYELALQRLGVDACEAVAIEDSPNGIAAALAAHLRVIGFTGASLVQDVSAATWPAGSYDEVAQLIQEELV